MRIKHVLENMHARRWALLFVALAGFSVLAPGFGGPFILDDFANVADNPNLEPETWTWEAIERAVLTNDSGPLGRPVSMLTFVGNAMTTGLDPAPMKFTNAVLHGITTILLGLFALRLFAAAPMGLNPRQQFAAALLATACWALHPIAITSTLYVVQRMNLLATLFTFATLLTYLRARAWFFRSWPRALPWLVLGLALWTLGFLSKENALLAPLYVLLLEWLIFDFRDERGEAQPSWRRFVLISSAVAAIAITTYFAIEWQSFTGVADIRGFTAGERLLTEARVIWHYVGMILLPSHARLGLFLDDIGLSTGLLQPWTTLLSLAGLATWVAAAVVLRKRAPLIAFGLLFFLAGHMMESTFFMLEIAFEHRNYLPSAGILIALGGAFMLLAKRLEAPILEWLPLGIFALFLAFFTVIRGVHWSDMYLLAQLEAFHHPQSARAQNQLGYVYTQFAHQVSKESGWREFYMDAAVGYFKKTVAIDPGATSPLFLWFLNARAFDRPFPDDAYIELLDRLRYGLPNMSTPGNLNSLYACVLDECGVSPLELETLFRVALENPKLRGRVRSETLVEAAKYFRFIRNDAVSTRILLAQAVQASPGNPRFRVFLVRELLSRGHVEAALEVVNDFGPPEKWGVFENEVSELLSGIKKTIASRGELSSDQQAPVNHSSGKK